MSGNASRPAGVGRVATALAARHPVDRALVATMMAEVGLRPDATRDELIATAVAAGKFSNKRAVHWAREYDREPETTRKLIDRLVPVLATTGTTRAMLADEWNGVAR